MDPVICSISYIAVGLIAYMLIDEGAEVDAKNRPSYVVLAAIWPVTLVLILLSLAMALIIAYGSKRP